MNKLGSDLAFRFASIAVPAVATTVTFVAGLQFGVSPIFAGAASMCVLCGVSNYFDILQVKHNKMMRQQSSAKMDISDIVSGESSVSSLLSDERENTISLGFDVGEYHKSYEKDGSVFIQKAEKDKMIELEFTNATLDTLYIKGSNNSNIVAGSNIHVDDSEGKVKVYCEEYGKKRECVDIVNMSDKNARDRLNSVVLSFRSFRFDDLRLNLVNLAPEVNQNDKKIVRKI